MSARGSVLAVLFLLVPLSGCFSEPAGKLASPAQKLGIEEQNTWDFGPVESGKIMEHDFTIKNETSALLQIKDVSTSCGCTVSQIRRNTLQRGESTSLNVKFNSKGYHGPVRQFVYVDTNDTQNPVMRFVVKADVFDTQPNIEAPADSHK
ncbi:MAG: DUF1573 domain-containing protein [Candidatus Omnitrophota bacterium]|jgi:hypothetical protein